MLLRDRTRRACSQAHLSAFLSASGAAPPAEHSRFRSDNKNCPQELRLKPPTLKRKGRKRKAGALAPGEASQSGRSEGAPSDQRSAPAGPDPLALPEDFDAYVSSEHLGEHPVLSATDHIADALHLIFMQCWH